MSSPPGDDDQVIFRESNFTFHDFTDRIGGINYSCQIMKMENSFYVYIGNAGDEVMNNLTYAFLSTYDNLPAATSLMGAGNNQVASSIASKLTQLCGKPIWVSFNLEAHGRMMLPLIKRVADEFKAHALA